MVRGRQWTGFEAVALQEAMRRSIREFAALLGVETTTISNWRAGLSSVTPRPRMQEILDTTLRLHATPDDTVRFEQLVAEGEVVWRKRHRSQGATVAEQLLATSDIAVPDSDVFERPVEIMARMHRLSSSDVDDTVIEVIALGLDDIIDRYELEGPARLAPEALSLRHHVETVVQQCRQVSQLPRLHRLAGQLSGVLGYMAVNRGRFQHAKMYCQEAFTIAEFTHDRDMQAWVRGTQSFCAYYEGKYDDAVSLAEEGIRVAGNSAQAIRLYTNGLARALGKQGNGHGVGRAIEAAQEISSATDTPLGLTPALTFSPYSDARSMANAATAYLSAGDYGKTLEYGDAVEAHVNASDSVWSRSLVRLDVATALVRQGSREVEFAMTLGVEALDASKDRPIRSIWQRAHDLADDVSAVDSGTVKTYVGELHEWSRQAKAITAPEA